MTHDDDDDDDDDDRPKAQNPLHQFPCNRSAASLQQVGSFHVSTGRLYVETGVMEFGH